MKTFLFVSIASLLTGCALFFTPLTKEELSQRGKRHFSKVGSERLTRVTTVALQSLGYHVTVTDSSTGLIRTAPHSMIVSATGSSGGANVTEDGLAWVVRIGEDSSGNFVQATPRGFRNGSEMRAEGIWIASIIDPKFEDLWREIEETLHDERKS